ncbi:hypothetical protein Phum_PHUM200890 [Pediculus humanus corporis]|uniref:Uncharacterized protein n=1 Tax=Pediculus humanus subsp. corporis TaxID=121224 RepID=E0VH49_PEDHC|nr:uncharacterized protein Phum_PHUM200890 [Pediculus humanus corporis]EEB12705.1 hypothetical protein Phum_PHUM200890 [Pediculus humanus corporis]
MGVGGVEEKNPFPELYPTEPPVFDVHFIRLNATVTKAVLWGPNGVMVMHIPKRWGPYGGFQGEKCKILTRDSKKKKGTLIKKDMTDFNPLLPHGHGKRI